MNRNGEYYFNLALELFEKYNYAEAVQNFIKAYNEGYCQEEIIQILYDCFITPNEEEFRNNYDNNRKDFTDMDYNETRIDFIPISDTEYYLWDKENQEFLGNFCVEERDKRPEELEFESLLIADVWDVRQVIEDMRTCNWSAIYFILNQQSKYFFSFFKLPCFKSIYMDKVFCYNTTEEMKKFFETHPDYYLPRKVIAPEPELYLNILNEVHEERIRNMEIARDNIYLSICIPSYNRGHIALQSVLYMLNASYDSEIEIVISDNGSTQNVQGYQELSALQDSRVRYVRLEENQGYASNIYNVLKAARGKFLVLCSDEDAMIVERLGTFLKYLKNHESAGVVESGGIGPNFVPLKPYIVEDKCQSIECAMNTNYLTGVTMNGDFLREKNIFEEFQKLRGNVFLETYAHMVFAMMLMKYGYFSNCGIILWNSWADAKDGANSWGTGGVETSKDEPPMLSYMWPESRIEQFNAVLEILEQLGDIKEEEFWLLLLNRMEKTYYLIYIVYKTRLQTFLQKYSWEDACIMVYNNNKLLQEKYNIEPIKTLVDEIHDNWLNYNK